MHVRRPRRLASWLAAGLLTLAAVGCQRPPASAPGGPAVAEGGSVNRLESSPRPNLPRWELSDEAIEARLLDDVRRLASDEFGGRGPYGAGQTKAAELIVAAFEQAGLTIDLHEGQPFQPFRPIERTVVETLEPPRFHGPGGEVVFDLEHDAAVLAAEPTVALDQELVFAGYGITVPEADYDDYADLDVDGKAVIVLRHEPRPSDADSPLAGAANSPHAMIDSKVANAARHGAAAVIFVTDQPTLSRRGGDALLSPRKRPADSEGIAVLHCRRTLVERLLELAGAPSLSEIERRIDASFRPGSISLPGWRLDGAFRRQVERRFLHNVMGLLPGEGTLAEELVVIGAHYDHLGMGGGGSLAPWTTAVHNGADDNASGSAALLEVARQLALRAPTPRRSLLFIAFSGEEMGLLGSEYYVRSPRFPLSQTVAMLNLDMVGRMRRDQLEISGVGTGDYFRELTERLAERHGLRARRELSGYGPSDHASFHAAGVPVMHFFTGLHSDYHRPSDDFDKINYAGARRVAALVVDAAEEIATRPRRPRPLGDSLLLAELTGSESSSPRRAAPARRSGVPPARGLGVSVADSTEPAGFRVTAIAERGPAERGGMQVGDIITTAAGEPVRTLESLREAVRGAPEGEALKLRVVRGGLELELSISFAEAAGEALSGDG